MQLGQEALLGVDGHERHLEGVAERAHDLLALVLAHEPVIYEHARELVAHGPVHEQRGHGGVDPAGEAADHLSIAHLRADALDLLLRDRRRRPAALAPAHIGQEPRQDLLAVGSVHDLGVELDAIHAPCHVLHRRHRRGARGGQLGEAVRARHPREQPARHAHLQVRAPELPHLGLLDATAELVYEQLHAVADPKHRHAQLQQPAIEPRRTLRVHRRGPAREDDPSWRTRRDLLDAGVVRQQLAEHAAVAHAPGDQLAVLTPVVQHDHLFTARSRRAAAPLGALGRGREGASH